MLVEQQIAERRARAGTAIAKILERPAADPYGDYRVKSASGKAYRVAMRGPGLFENYCSCPDFAANTLGTCKHIEALLLRLANGTGGGSKAKHMRGPAPPFLCSTAKASISGCAFRPLRYRSFSN